MVNGMHNNYYANMLGECVYMDKQIRSCVSLCRQAGEDGGIIIALVPILLRKKFKFMSTVHAPGEICKPTNP